MIDAVLERFEVQAPVATMVRATMANVLDADRLDEIFRDSAVQQRESQPVVGVGKINASPSDG